MRPVVLSFVLIGLFLLVSLSSLAQPVWDPGFPLVRAEARSLGMGVNLNMESTVYYVIYNASNTAGNTDPGANAFTAAQIKAGTTAPGGTNKIAAGSFNFGDGSYSITAPPANFTPSLTLTRFYSYFGFPNINRSYRVYFTAESIASPGLLTAPQDREVTVFRDARCFKVGQVSASPDPGKNKSILGVCSPSDINYTVTYTGVDAFSVNKAQINWGDGNVIAYDLTLSNPTEMNKEFRRYETTQVHTYLSSSNTASNPPGGECTFHLDIDLVIAGTTVCSGTNQDDEHTVWDDPGVRGVMDIDGDGPDAGDEEFEVCEQSRAMVTLTDASDFNCTDAVGGNELGRIPSNPNNEARWVQWVYGAAGTNITTTASADPDEKVTINGQSFQLSDFPIYGPVEFVAGPVTQAFSTALPVQMPTTAITNQLFIIQLRSWNTCRPYDSNTGDGGLNPIGGVFDVGPNVNTKWFNAAPGYVYPGNGTLFPDASEAPVVTTKNIIIIDAPDPPVVPDRDVCSTLDASNADLLSVTSPLGAGFTYRWWSDAATSVPVGTGTTFNPDNTVAPNGVRTHFWVTVESTGPGTCRSQPTEVRLIKRAELLQPPVITVVGIASNPDDLCPNTSYTFTVTTAPANVTILDPTPSDPDVILPTDYTWTFPTGWNITSGLGTETITATSPATAAASANISVVRNYESGTSTPPVAVFCNSTARNKAVTVRARPTSVISPDPALLCEANSLQLNGNPVLAFGTIASHSWTGDNTILDNATIQQPTIPSGTAPLTYNLTYTVIAEFDPGVSCSGSDNITVTVNPNPPKPTITPSGVTTFCFGGNVTLTSSSVTATSYQWFKDGNPVGGATNATLMLNAVAQSGVYTVRTFGVASTNCQSPLSDAVTVTIKPLPSVTNVTGGGSVCGLNPAPDIIFTLTGTQPFNFTIDRPGAASDIVVTGHTSTTYVLSGQVTAGNYQISALTDASTCPATSLGGFATVTIGGTAVTVNDVSVTNSAVCDDGSTTTDMIVQLDLDGGVVAGYSLFYKINGGPLLSKTFNTDGSGDASVTFDYVADFGGTPTPSPHVLSIESVVTPAPGCQTSVGESFNYFVNLRPGDATNAVGAVACSTAPGSTISVDPPPAGNIVLWFDNAILTSPATGSTGGTRQSTFTPTSSATVTYYAVVQSTTVPTNCKSNNAITVQHTQDVSPTPPNIITAPGETCSTSLALSATPVVVGTGYWSTAGLLYFENFQTSDGTIVDNGVHGWSRSITGITLAPGDYFEVRSGRFAGEDLDAGTTTAFWRSESINVSSITAMDISLDLRKDGQLENADFIEAWYVLDGVPTKFGEISRGVPDGAPGIVNATATATSINVSANTNLVIEIRMRSGDNAEIQSFDNVVVRENSSSPLAFDDIFDPATTVRNLQVGANTIVWNVESALGACTFAPDNVVITRIALPTGVDHSDAVCTGTPTIDLTSYEAIVAGGSMVNRSVTWFTDNNRTVSVSSSTAEPFTAGQAFYALVEETVSTQGCTNVVPGPGSVTINTLALPVANSQTPSVCEEINPGPGVGTGFGTGFADDIDLTALNNGITGGATSRTITWYNDPTGLVDDPSDLTAPFLIAGAGDVDGVVNNQVFYALVQNDLTLCLNIAKVTYTIKNVPDPQTFSGDDPTCASAAPQLYTLPDLTTADSYVWNYPANIPGQFKRFGGGGLNEGFLLLQFPSLSSPPSPDNYLIRVAEVKNGCQGIFNEITITVEDTPSPNPIHPPGIVCKNSDGVTIQTESEFNGDPNNGNNYTWSVFQGDAAIVGAAAGQNLDKVIVDFGSAPVVKIRVEEVSPTGCNGPPQEITISTNDQPSMTSLSTAEICSDEFVEDVHVLTANVTPFTPPNTPLHFDWQVASINPPGSVSGIVVGNTGTATDNGEIGHALFNISGIIGTVVYNVTPVSDAGCRGDTKPLTLTVHPKPVLLASQNKTICSGSDVDYEIRLSPPNAPSTTVFNWGDPDLTGPASAGVNVPLGASGTLHITDNLINTGSLGSFDVVYNIIPSNPISGTKSCFGLGQNITITVNPEPVSANPTNLSNICSDANVNYALQNSITNTVNSTFQWQAAVNDPDVTGESNSLRNTSTIDDVIVNPSGTHQLISYNVTPTGTVAFGSCPGDPFTVNITVERKPVASPQLLTAICSSTTTAVGYTLQSAVTNSVASNFEWLVPVPNASVSGGATSLVTSNTITDVLRNTTSIQHSVIYSVTPKAQNDLQCAGTSFTVTVPVNPEPIGTTLSLPDFCSQGNVNYSLQPNVNGNNSVPSSFEWRVLGPDDNALISGQSTSIQASATINNTLINVSGGNEQLTYTITPRSIAPANCLGADFKITVIVKPEPVGFAETLSTICSDNAPGYVIQTQNINTLPGNSVPSTFVWHPTVDNPDVIGDENLGNRTTATINETLVNTASLIAENVVYEILPTGTNGCAGEAFEITVPVGPKPVGTTVSAATLPPGIASPDICSQTTFTYDLQANVNFTNPVPSNFTWSTSADSFVDNEITTPTPGNAISNTLVNKSQFSRTLTYIVNPVSVDGCPGDPFNVSVFVKNEPVGWNDITFPAICSQEDVGYDIQNVNLNTSPGNSLSSNFVWKVLGPDNNVNIQNQSTSDNTNPTIDDDLVNMSATDQSLVYTVLPTGKTPNGCVGSPFRITVLVHPEPVGATANPGAVCSDVAHAIDLQNLLVHPGVASSFTWRAVSDVTDVTGESLNDQHRDFIDDAIKNEKSLPITVPYTVTPVSDVGSCEGFAFTVNVRTTPEPKGSADIKTICSGDNVNYSLQNNINLNNALNSTFTWKAIADIGDISGESLLNQIPVTIGDVLGNNSNPGIPLNVIYQVTPVSGGCTGDNFNITVTISPRPIVPASIPEAVLCSGLPFSISLQSKVTNNVPSNFAWTAVYAGVLSGGSGSGSNTISETLSNLGGSQLNATYSVSVANAAAPFCTGTSFTLIKPIDPQPVTDPALAAVNICSDLPTGILLNTNGISIGANKWDVDFISVTPNLTPNASNAVDPGSAQATNYIQNDRYTNTSSTLGFAEYLVTPVGPAANFCRGVQTLVRLEVRPEPVMNPALTASTVVCSDETIGIVLSTNGTSVAAQSYIYSSLEDPPGTPVATAPGNPPVSGSDRIASIIQNDKYTNVSPTGATLTRVYIVKPKSAANCLGNEIAIPVQVLPEPDFNFAALIPPVCSGVPINLALTPATATPIAKYQITNINWDVLPTPGLMPGGSNLATGITVAATASGFTIPDTYTNGTSISLQAHYKVIPIATTVGTKTCVGNEKIATVDILPSPVVDADLDKIVCNDAVNSITITTEGTSAPAQSFEIVRTSLPAGLTAGVYATGTQVVNGLTTNNIAADHVINSTDNPLIATYAIRANTGSAGAGCYGPVENITVTVEPQFRITLSGPPGNTNNAKPNICSADDTEIALVSPSNPTAGDVTFNFTAAAAIPGTISGMSPGFNLDETDIIAQVLSNSSNNPVDVTYTVTPRANSAAGGTGCVGTASTTVVKVEPKPKMKATPTSLIVCEGVPLGLDLSSTTIPSTGAASMFFTHTSIEDLNTGTLPVNVTRLSPVHPIPHDYSAGTDVVNDVLKNDGVGQEFIRYNFTPSFTILSGTCLGDPVSVNITVNPRPVMVSVSPAPASVPFTIDPQCSAAPFSKIFSDYVTEADLSSTLVTWTYSYSSGDPAVKGASPGAGFELSQVVFNGTGAPITVTYSIKAKAFNCESNTIQVPVVIYPIPKITGLPQKVDVCDDASLNVPLNSTASNTLYTWEVDDQAQPQLSGATDRPLASAATGPLFFSALSNADDELHNYEFIITPQVNTSMGVACYGDPKQLLVNVAPPVGGDISTSQGAQSFICAGSSETIMFEFDGHPNFKIGYIEGGIPKTREGQGHSLQITTQPSATTVYTLVSVKDAFGCEAVLNKNATVNVFRKPLASFDEGSIPPFAGGALVNFTNTSTPLDFSEFRYEWAFGADSDPRFSSVNSVIIPVNYKQAGLKDVTLKATNILAEAAGVTCLDSFEKTIEILLPPLVAAFTATPLAACFPVDIEVKTAISGADTYKWQVIDQSGRIAATALTKDPVFHIVNPGTYDVFLEASHSFTGQVAFAQQEGIEIFDNPVASLEARPTTLFIPDTELITFNFSTGANFYEWDFDDGTVSEDFEPKHLYNVEGTYEVTLIAGYNHGEKDSDGDGVTDGEVICYDTARRQVIARQGGLTKLPNAFTPSKNGPSGGTSGSGTFNDVFLPITKGVAREDGAFVMQIFDRWGTLIFESRIQTKGWDGYDKNGNLVPAGVYVYKLDLRLADGQRTTQVGDVTVIR